MKNSVRNYVFLDVETTIKNKGNPFTPSNKLVWVGLKDKEGYHEYPIEYQDTPYGDSLNEIKTRIEAADLLIGFNIKFDLHWIRRYVPNIQFPCVFDCQLAEFLLSNQQTILPSLDEVAGVRGCGSKYDIIHNEYWKNGIDTDLVPRDILSKYTRQDVELTESVFRQQAPELKDNLKRLFVLQCEDLLCLEEMEWNGIQYDIEQADLKGKETIGLINDVNNALFNICPMDFINWDSSDHISAILYGGEIKEKYRETYERILKSGEIKQRERWTTRIHILPRMVEPLRGSENKDEKTWSVGEPTITRLRCSGKPKKIIELLLRRSSLSKLNSTYYQGLIDKYQEMEWQRGILHGQFNQCIARTSRLSSSNPNLQNFSSKIKELFSSRFVKEEGVLINADWKGLEWAVAVHLSGDATGRAELFAGVDQHYDNQRRLGLPSGDIGRLLAKIFVFRLIYGGSAYAYANDAEFNGVSTKESFWQDIIDRFYAKYSGLRRWHEAIVEEVMRTGCLVLPTGRVFKYTKNLRGEWPRTIILNYPVQGLGAELMMIARVLLWRLWKEAKKLGQIKKALLVSTVHDSVLSDCPKDEAAIVTKLIKQAWDELPEFFEKTFGEKLTVPIKVVVTQGTNWKDQQEIQE